MQDESSVGVALPFGGVTDPPVPQAFQDLLQQIEVGNANLSAQRSPSGPTALSQAPGPVVGGALPQGALPAQTQASQGIPAPPPAVTLPQRLSAHRWADPLPSAATPPAEQPPAFAVPARVNISSAPLYASATLPSSPAAAQGSSAPSSVGSSSSSVAASAASSIAQTAAPTVVPPTLASSGSAPSPGARAAAEHASAKAAPLTRSKELPPASTPTGASEATSQNGPLPTVYSATTPVTSVAPPIDSSVPASLPQRGPEATPTLKPASAARTPGDLFAKRGLASSGPLAPSALLASPAPLAFSVPLAPPAPAAPPTPVAPSSPLAPATLLAPSAPIASPIALAALRPANLPTADNNPLPAASYQSPAPSNQEAAANDMQPIVASAPVITQGDASPAMPMQPSSGVTTPASLQGTAPAVIPAQQLSTSETLAPSGQTQTLASTDGTFGRLNADTSAQLTPTRPSAAGQGSPLPNDGSAPPVPRASATNGAKESKPQPPTAVNQSIRLPGEAQPKPALVAKAQPYVLGPVIHSQPGTSPSSPAVAQSLVPAITRQTTSSAPIDPAITAVPAASPDRMSAPPTGGPAKGPMENDDSGASVTSAPANPASVPAPFPTGTAAVPDAGHTSSSNGGIPASPALAPAVSSAPQPPTAQPSSPPHVSGETRSTVASPSELPDAPSPALTHARLLQTMNGSQMQVNLSSEEFGRVSVHAGYSREALTAQITLESSQLGSAITAHLPGAEQKLAGDHGLRTSISVATNTGNGSPADSRSGSDQRNSNSNNGQRNGPFSRSSLSSTDSGSPAAPSSSSVLTPSQATSGRLNIRI